MSKTEMGTMQKSLPYLTGASCPEIISSAWKHLNNRNIPNVSVQSAGGHGR